MLPLLSSPGWPLRRHAAACDLRSVSRGWRTRAATKETKIGESGQP